MIHNDGEKEGEGDPDRGRAESPSDVQAKDHPVEEVKSNADDRELLDGEVERKEIQVALNGKGKRDNHPAAVTNNEDKDQEKDSGKKAEERARFAAEGLAGHPRGGDKEAEGDEAKHDLLSGEILHEL